MSQMGAASVWTWPWRRREKRAVRPLIDRLAAPLDDMLHVLVQESSVGIAIVDREGRLVRVNAALRRMVDRSCDLSPGQPTQDIFCESGREALWDQLSPALQGRLPLRNLVSVLRGKSGVSEQTVEISAVALREADESVSGAILQLTDISMQKRLEVQLAQSQKLQAVGQLAGGIAHDFNNLLTAIIGASDDLLEDGGDEASDDLRLIRTSAERGAALVRQLLAFGRQQTLQPRVLPINDAVEALTGLLRRLLGSAVRLELELEQPGCTALVDPTQLDQVLVNLAVNARDAMPEGGQLTLRTGHITLFRALIRGDEAIPPGRYVMVEVQDTGCGIPPDVLPRIFDPFFTTRRERGGTGLGLSTVHGIIRQSNGFLAVDSLPGEGTRMRIYLPRRDGEGVAIPRPPAAATIAAATQGAPAAPRGPRTMLLVDDEDGVRRLAARAFAKQGWTVLSAESGEAALALLELDGTAESLSAIVSDVVMPGMGGAALVRAVRALRPGLPAILASGYAEEALRGDLAAEGIGFLAKPYMLRDMLAVVEALVEGQVTDRQA